MVHQPSFFCSLRPTRRASNYKGSLEAFGAYVCPMLYANELGLRILIGGAVREASVLGYSVTPLFSYYSCHGPVFRVLLQMNRGKLPEKR
ncbi:hypothetical protein F3Y22_tig00004258pilonHSYRG00060 [Hibiscus syriacus]|uniref:Uncharacterized protein n=1 Tax=Hibiscus syriacus TaxID=106335 RepID=A0A6A3CMV1_HIBSY|nr:hypothetical protein F3Y22_tig00004258pilonHSYRG00060 [Hibiscus syriacus]